MTAKEIIQKWNINKTKEINMIEYNLKSLPTYEFGIMSYNKEKENIESKIIKLKDLDCKHDLCYSEYELEILKLGIEAKEKELSQL